MPKLEHANLVVNAIEPTVEFLTAAFPSWHIRGEGDQPFAGIPRHWVHLGDDEFYLALTAYDIDPGKKGPQRNLSGTNPGLAHIGFEVSSLDALAARLKTAGHEPHHQGAEHPFRRNLYYINDEGLEFEFVEYLSDDPKERNSYD